MLTNSKSNLFLRHKNNKQFANINLKAIKKMFASQANISYLKNLKAKLNFAYLLTLFSYLPLFL